MKHRLCLSPIASVSSVLAGGTLVAFGVGPTGVVYFVVALNPLDYRTEQPGWASFAKTVPDEPQRYRVVGLSGSDAILDTVIENEPFNIHHVQPLNDELLLVCSRSHYKGPTQFEKNGRVYSRSGRFQREMLLGDGIQDVQATSNGVIWTSFFDEGIFGNYGWENPVGASGLVAWDFTGNKLYEFEAAGESDAMSDCYALNVQSDDDVWCYYYTDFPLVHLHGQKIVSALQVPVSGSDAFAVWGNHALFRGEYKNHDTYRLLSLSSAGEATLLAEIELYDQEGVKIAAERVMGRGDNIHVLSGQVLYKVGVREAIAVHEG
ncbi:MAG: hypothetical protein OEV63_10120 [Gammaproteobacteria bacterium]|nr:hypothetical protein [Gammaproteobacteria bacterium]